MSYVDANYDIKNGVILISERVAGQRVLKRLPLELFFYYQDPGGQFVSTTGVRCSRFSTTNYDVYKEEIDSMARMGRKTFESDVKPIFKGLETLYKDDRTLPALHTAYFDIETDFDPERGFSSPSEAFMPITAISIEHSWTGKLYSLAIKPQGMAKADAEQIMSKFENSILCDSESQLLDMFLNLIEDADILTGWNSASFDIPYIVHRIQKVRGKKDTTRLCLWKQYPKLRTFERYGNEVKTFDLTGRLHVDYLDLYRKYTYHELPSYRLDYVGEIEVKENKVPYEGTLHELYNKDFEKFIAYSRQDTRILGKLDAKLRYINLLNFVAHENLVTMPSVMGSVALSDNAILLETHKRHMVAPTSKSVYEYSETIAITDDDEDENADKIAGAFVKDPKPGMYEWIASVDLNSLYPSAFRALNMSTETLVGSIDQTLTQKMFEERQAKSRKKLNNAELWSGIFEIPEVQEVQNKTPVPLTLTYEDGEKQTLSAAQLWNKMIQNNWMLSANGVLFRTDIEGVIPSLLSTWYKERKEYQKRLKQAYVNLSSNPDDQKLKDEVEYWDKMQLVRKIMLNSVYGALTNPGSKYYDQRMGQSCTLTGRSIARHMGYKINEILMGVYEFGDAIIYGDTDSVAADTMIKTDAGETTIEALFEKLIRWTSAKDGKEYGLSKHNMRVMGYNPETSTAELMHFQYVYRHKVKKKRWQITSKSGKVVDVTEDHSVMIERAGNLIEVKAEDIVIKTDLLISVKDDTVVKEKVKKVENIGKFKDEYVYDIGINDKTPYFFANDILVHNSVYFSPSPIKDVLAENGFEITKDSFVELADSIADDVNASFPAYLKDSFNVPLDRGEVIKCGREICATRGLFIKKKRYACLYYDKEGKRYDNDLVSGEVKIMGIETQRSDTPIWVQGKLKDMIYLTLDQNSEDKTIEFITDMRKEFETLPSWMKGTPKRVNNLSYYYGVWASGGKTDEGKTITIPGHVRAAINWNNIREAGNDHSSTKILDGQKVIVCKLRHNNNYGITSIAFPIDQHNLPDWFTKLPFDDSMMVETIIDKKVENIIGTLGWDLDKAKESEVMKEMFSWS